MTVLVTKEAPNFKASAILSNNEIDNNFILHEKITNKISVLFFYPLDFTFVCPSELIALGNKMPEFKKRGVEVIGISVDSHYSHLAYKKTPVENGGIGNLQLTLVSDLTKNISRDYGILYNESVALRGCFIIDENKIVRHQLVNDLPLGRNIDEILRIIDALIHFEKHGEVCPADWRSGKEAIKPSPEGIAEYLKDNATKL